SSRFRSYVERASRSAISDSLTAFLTWERSRAWFTSGSTRASTCPRFTASPSRTSSSVTLPERTDLTSTFTSGSTEPTSVTLTWTSATSAFAVLTLFFSSSGLALGRVAAKPTAAGARRPATQYPLPHPPPPHLPPPPPL